MGVKLGLLREEEVFKDEIHTVEFQNQNKIFIKP
jgi:hypothetical protein